VAVLEEGLFTNRKSECECESEIEIEITLNVGDFYCQLKMSFITLKAAFPAVDFKYSN